MKILQVKEITNLLGQNVTRVGSEDLFVQTKNTALQYSFTGKYAVVCSVTNRGGWGKILRSYSSRQDIPGTGSGDLWWNVSPGWQGNRKYGYVILRDAQALSIEYDGVEYITYPEE